MLGAYILTHEGGSTNHVANGRSQASRVPVLNTTPRVHCKVFEDNAGAIEIAKVPKMRPRTKHLNIKYHHFREEVRKGTISIYHTKTEDQVADIFTKPLPEQSFTKFRENMMGW
jgi:hypothetical protein